MSDINDSQQIDHVASEASYRKHRRRNESCEACRKAHSDYVRQRRIQKQNGEPA